MCFSIMPQGCYGINIKKLQLKTQQRLSKPVKTGKARKLTDEVGVSRNGEDIHQAFCLNTILN